jgi:hypothetical protein
MSEPNEVENKFPSWDEVEDKVPDNSWKRNPNVRRNGPNVIADGGSISLTPEALRDLVSSAVAAAVTAANAPKPPTEQEMAAIKMQQDQRRENAEQIKRGKENKRRFSEFICTHEHAQQAGGGTHCVHVRDNDHPDSPGYIYCQNCEGRFRGESEKWRKLDPDAIFDTAKFNLLFQKCAGAQGEIIG